MSEWIAAAATPYGVNGEVDFRVYAAHLRRLLVCGVSGVLVAGSTGEVSSLTLRERIVQLESVVQAGISPDRVIAGIGSCSLPDSMELAGKALEMGFHRLLWCPPFYYKVSGTEGLETFMGRILDLPGAEQFRILLYHIPKYTGVPITVELTERLLTLFPEQIAGIKDSGGDGRYTQRLIRNFPRLSIYSGSEKGAMALMEEGLAGIISATFNLGVHPPTDKPGEVDLMTEPHLIAMEKRRDILDRYPLIAAVKSALAAVDSLETWRMVRPPLVNLTPESESTVQRQVCSDSWIKPLTLQQGGD